MSEYIKAADALAEAVDGMFKTSSAEAYLLHSRDARTRLAAYRQSRKGAESAKVKPLVWHETETGYMTQDYIGMYEVYLNAEGTWTFDSGESVSAHASKEAAMAQGPKEHLRRIKTALED